VEENKPVDVTFNFPKEVDTVISRMVFIVGDKRVQAQVKANEEVK